MGENIPEYSCDKWIVDESCNWRKRRCGKKPYCEVYRIGIHSWSYLCRWHYILDRLGCKIFRIKTHGYYIIDENDKEDGF